MTLCLLFHTRSISMMLPVDQANRLKCHFYSIDHFMVEECDYLTLASDRSVCHYSKSGHLQNYSKMTTDQGRERRISSCTFRQNSEAIWLPHWPTANVIISRGMAYISHPPQSHPPVSIFNPMLQSLLQENLFNGIILLQSPWESCNSNTK